MTPEEIRVQVAWEMQHIEDSPERDIQTLFRGSYEALRMQQLSMDSYRHKSETMSELLEIYGEQHPEFIPAYNSEFFFGL